MNRSKCHCRENRCQGTVHKVMLHICIYRWQSDVRLSSEDILNSHIFVCSLSVTDEHMRRNLTVNFTVTLTVHWLSFSVERYCTKLGTDSHIITVTLSVMCLCIIAYVYRVSMKYSIFSVSTDIVILLNLLDCYALSSFRITGRIEVLYRISVVAKLIVFLVCRFLDKNYRLLVAGSSYFSNISSCYKWRLIIQFQKPWSKLSLPAVSVWMSACNCLLCDLMFTATFDCDDSSVQVCHSFAFCYAGDW